MMRRKTKKRSFDNISWGGKVFVTVFVLIVIVLNSEFLEVYAEIYSNLDLKEHIIPLKTTKAGSGFEDLEPLKEILKDKKIVAMGEAAHGTKEFFEMKHRMFEFLVEEMGYRAFAIEAGFGESQRINDYILSGDGNAYDATQTLSYGVWHTEEVLRLIEWMRDYNKSSNNAEKIRFYGFDMKPVTNDVDAVIAYLEKVDKEIDLKYQSSLNAIRKREKININIIEELKDILEENKESYIDQTSILEYETVYHHLEVINQWMDFREVTDFIDSANKRDQYMAENVKWIFDYEKHFNNDKIMLWAHNGHVSKKFTSYKSMGEHLKEAYGENLYAIGFDFYKGSFMSLPGNILSKVIANKMAQFTIKKGYDKSFAAVFERAKIPLCFMDFKLASKDRQVYEWLSQEQYVRSIGSTYSGRYIPWFAPEIPMESYDGIIYVEETKAAERMNKEEEIIGDGDRYLFKYYIIRLFIIVLIFITIVVFIKIKKRKKLIH